MFEISEENKKHAKEFYLNVIKSGGNMWGERDYCDRLKSNRPIKKELIPYLPKEDVVGGTLPIILDVGASLATDIGEILPNGQKATIVPIDALASIYWEVEKELDIHVPNLTGACFAEELTKMFPENCFDIVYSHNAWDHFCDPILALEQMTKVLKIGCYLCIFVYENEGLGNNYKDMHQWNVKIKNLKPYLWSPKLEVPFDIFNFLGEAFDDKEATKQGRNIFIKAKKIA